MKIRSRRSFLVSGVCLAASLAILAPPMVPAQWPFAPPQTPTAQREAQRVVKAQVGWLQNATRTAGNFGANGYGNVLQQFNLLRGAYSTLKQTLTPGQLSDGANAFAELDAGLDIIQEAFTNYQSDVAAGQPINAALNNMCQVLSQASSVWLQELNKTCSRVRVGF
jgi:hypothetical protein